MSTLPHGRSPRPGVMSKILIFFLAAVTAMLCACAPAAEVTEAGAVPVETTWTWEKLSNGTARITGCSTAESFLVVPEAMDGVTVSALGDDVLAGNRYVATVILPESIVAVGNRSFKDCGALRSINLDNVTVIGSEAFSGCQFLGRAGMSPELELIGKGAFENCDTFEQVILPGTMDSIPEDAFRDCDRLKKIVVSKGITSIGKSAFQSCPALTEIELASSVRSIGQYAFSDCAALESVSTRAVTIGSCAFMGCTGMKSARLMDGVTTIGQQAFEGCTALEELVIPGSLETIGESAFSGCSSLGQVDIPATVITIRRDAFAGCGKLSIVAAEPSAGQLYADTYGIPRQAPAIVSASDADEGEEE